MQIGVATVGTDPVVITITEGYRLQNGLRLLAREANAGDVYVGTSSDITTTSGVNLVPKGDPATSNWYTVPEGHFDGVRYIYLVASQSGQLVDWSAD
jgi:hypothetical protein